MDVKSPDLDGQVAKHDLVISLVPFVYHADVIRSAIKGQTHVVTTSYVSPAMKELEGAAKEAGITILNEVGMDPGIDHLYAVKTIGEVHEKGGKVPQSPMSSGIGGDESLLAVQIKEFTSFCGGLPAPEISHNPLRFKVKPSSKSSVA